MSLLAPVAEVTLALPAGRFPGCTGHFSVLEKTDCLLSLQSLERNVSNLGSFVARPTGSGRNFILYRSPGSVNRECTRLYKLEGRHLV